MTLQEAIIARHSVRQYQERPIEDDKKAQLQQAVEDANQAGGLHLQLVTDEPAAFSKGLAKYGKFSGVSNYIALVARKGLDEQLGYHGEHIVLLAQTLGLNSCWVGLTFSKQPDHYTVAPDEHLYGVIALGYGANQGVQHPMKPIEKFYKAPAGQIPDWFMHGMQAALLAPTAVNMQKFEFELHDTNRVSARTRFALVGSYREVDLGIVKYHFEIGAGKENFVWTD